MKNYCCETCKMEVKPLVCGKCDCELTDTVVEKNGQKIKVVECAKCKGKIKAPFCCGHEMKH